MRVAAIALVALGLQAVPPQVTQIQEWFEAGRYQQVVDVASQASDPEAQYLVASSFDRLGQYDDARRVYSELAARGDADPWGWIGRSASNLVGAAAAPSPQVMETAQAAAQQAVAMLTPVGGAPGLQATSATSGSALAVAHYQLGQIHAFRRDYEQAAAACDLAIEADPDLAYAHYFAGMSYRQLRRIDMMAERFEAFLRLAPEAPEQTRVESMMRTVRGR